MDFWVGVETKDTGDPCIWFGIDGGPYTEICAKIPSCYKDAVPYGDILSLVEDVFNQLSDGVDKDFAIDLILTALKYLIVLALVAMLVWVLAELAVIEVIEAAIVGIGGGLMMISDETIQIDIGPFGVLKRLYEQSRLIVVFVIVSLLLSVYMSVFEPSPLRELAQFAVFFAIAVFALGVIFPKIWGGIGMASEIRHTVIDRVEYTTGSRLRPPTLRIIVTDGEETGTRPVPLSHRRLGGDQQLEHAIQAFEEAGISVTSADDTTDDDR